MHVLTVVDVHVLTVLAVHVLTVLDVLVLTVLYVHVLTTSQIQGTLRALRLKLRLCDRLTDKKQVLYGRVLAFVCTLLLLILSSLCPGKSDRSARSGFGSSCSGAARVRGDEQRTAAHGVSFAVWTSRHRQDFASYGTPGCSNTGIGTGVLICITQRAHAQYTHVPYRLHQCTNGEVAGLFKLNAIDGLPAFSGHQP